MKTNCFSRIAYAFGALLIINFLVYYLTLKMHAAEQSQTLER